jgi:hypothetical protein
VTTVTELDLPEFDYLADDLVGQTYHQRLAELRGRGWLARSPVSYVVLDREAGEFFSVRRQRPSRAGRSPTCSASPAAGCAS